MSKKISEMSEQELQEEIERMRAIPVPATPTGKRQPKRLDEQPKKRKGWMDELLGE